MADICKQHPEPCAWIVTEPIIRCWFGSVMQLTTTQRDALWPAELGKIIMNIDTLTLETWDGVQWLPIGSSTITPIAQLKGLTDAEIGALPAPQIGTVVYSKDRNLFLFWDGASSDWTILPSPAMKAVTSSDLADHQHPIETTIVYNKDTDELLVWDAANSIWKLAVNKLTQALSKVQRDAITEKPNNAFIYNLTDRRFERWSEADNKWLPIETGIWKEKQLVVNLKAGIAQELVLIKNFPLIDATYTISVKQPTGASYYFRLQTKRDGNGTIIPLDIIITGATTHFDSFRYTTGKLVVVSVQFPADELVEVTIETLNGDDSGLVAGSYNESPLGAAYSSVMYTLHDYPTQNLTDLLLAASGQPTFYGLDIKQSQNFNVIKFEDKSVVNVECVILSITEQRLHINLFNSNNQPVDTHAKVSMDYCFVQQYQASGGTGYDFTENQIVNNAPNGTIWPLGPYKLPATENIFLRVSLDKRTYANAYHFLRWEYMGHASAGQSIKINGMVRWLATEDVSTIGITAPAGGTNDIVLSVLHAF